MLWFVNIVKLECVKDFRNLKTYQKSRRINNTRKSEHLKRIIY